MRTWIRDLIDDFRAWRRSEVRVGPRGSRGRVYRKKDGAEPEAPGGVTKRKRHVKVSARVFRAAGGPVEHLDLVSKEM